MWLHSPDPAFREKVNEIVGLYLNPPEDAVVLCIDEKTGMQATERKHETQRPLPGRPGRYECEYIRHGTQSLLASFDINTGRVVASCGSTRTAEDLLTFMEQVAVEYRDAKRIIVVWDNLNIHHDGKSLRWTEFNERHGGRFEFRFTPLHASWVNQVEIFFSILHRRCLKYGSFISVEDLRNKVLAFIKRWNEKDGHAFDWCFRGYPIQSKAKAVA
jgi:transposase